MASIRELIKRTAPRSARSAFISLRARLAPPALEETVLHPYEMRRASGGALRISLVIPTLAPERVFGGIATGLEIFLECGRRTGAQLRILLDDFDRAIDRGLLEKWARRVGMDSSSIELRPRTSDVEPVEIGANDFFVAFNWWTALNIVPMIRQQRETFGGEQRPLIYLIQEYEPGFYPFSSTHLFARAAFELTDRVWGVFNSSQLHRYFRAQGHGFEREYVFEPRLAAAMRPFLEAGPAEKEKRILVYGRPSIPRNCFPAIVLGLRDWAERYPEFSDWTVASAGARHRPVTIGDGRKMGSLGKLPIEGYAERLRSTAIGISLMSSPHPSYPPLEMAHFGVRTLTNGYFCKDLSTAHDNIVTLPDIAPRTLADGLAKACAQFEAAPQAGWARRSHMPEYLEQGAYRFLDELAADIVSTAK
jgi:hypothetical protein